MKKMFILLCKQMKIKSYLSPYLIGKDIIMIVLFGAGEMWWNGY